MRRTQIAWLVVLLSLACGSAAADRTSSQFFIQRGDKALAARSWSEAEQHYRRALEEDPTNLPARYGVAEALLGSGQRGPGVAELRGFCEEAEQAGTLPSAWSALLTKARRKLADLDVAGNELEKLLSDHATAVLAFAGRWKEKDRETAVRALEDLLALQPGHAKATEMLESLGSDAGRPWTPLFNGKDKEGWTRLGEPTWKVEEGLLHARPTAGAYIGLTKTFLEGDFDVRMEVKLFERTGSGLSMFALTGSFKEERVKVLFGVLADEVVVRVYEGHPDDHEEMHAVLARNTKPPLDETAWNRYELRYRKDTVTAVLNGKDLVSFPRTALRDSGYVGLHVQHCHVAFRRVEYVQH